MWLFPSLVSVTIASVPASPVVVTPTVIVSAIPSCPAGPLSPFSPLSPLGPVGPTLPIFTGIQLHLFRHSLSLSILL